MRDALVVAADVADRLIMALCKGVTVVTTVALTLVMTANVFARHVLPGGGFNFAQELPTLLFPWFIGAGIVMAAISGTHMAVEYLYEKLTPRGCQILFVAMSLITACCFVVLLREALSVAAIAAAERSPILRLPNSIGYYSVAATALLVSVSLVTQSIRVSFRGWEARQPASIEDLPV